MSTKRTLLVAIIAFLLGAFLVYMGHDHHNNMMERVGEGIEETAEETGDAIEDAADEVEDALD